MKRRTLVNLRNVTTARFLFATVFFGLGVLLMAAVIYGSQAHSPLPSNISKQISFPVFIPTETVNINSASYKFDPRSGVLSFTGTLPDGQIITFSEQSSPSEFTDIPNFYSQFLKTLYEYESFDSLLGTVYLTHPKNAGQSAVMNSKGTLVFIRVDRDEPKLVWSRLVGKLMLYQP